MYPEKHSATMLAVVTAAATILMLAESSRAQMCKWVGEDGSVHYAEQCPEGVDGERVTLQASPSREQAEAAESRARQALESVMARDAEQRAQQEDSIEFVLREDRQYLAPEDVQCPTANRADYVRQMEARCEQAREAYIAPLRQAEIERCVREEGRDLAWCERDHADYFNPQNPWFIKEARVFDHLPECVIARTCRGDAGLSEN